MTRFEALGILPDTDELTRLHAHTFATRGKVLMVNVLDLIPLNTTFQLRRTRNRKYPYAIVMTALNLQDGKFYSAAIAADTQKVLRNKKRFGWKFQSAEVLD